MSRWCMPMGLVLAAFTLPGCSTKTFPVEGKIVYPDGKPAKDLAGGTVFFQHVDGKTSAAGDIDENGSFRLHFGEQDGAPAGEYRVYIEPAGEVAGEAIPTEPGQPRPSKPKVKLDPRFLSPTETPLRETVKAEPNSFTLKVERAK